MRRAPVLSETAQAKGPRWLRSGNLSNISHLGGLWSDDPVISDLKHEFSHRCICKNINKQCFLRSFDYPEIFFKNGIHDQEKKNPLKEERKEGGKYEG